MWPNVIRTTRVPSAVRSVRNRKGAIAYYAATGAYLTRLSFAARSARCRSYLQPPASSLPGLRTMRRSTRERSSTPSRARKRLESIKDSHQNPAFYVERGSEGSQYEPLDPNQDEIRLLRLKPSSNPTDIIECELFHTCLITAPPYYCLSYSWGARAKPQTIKVDGSPTSVTPNLRNALQQLRPKAGKDDLILWVDALCINQSDIPERNLQTGKMRMIYSHAKSVYVWLGPKNKKSEIAMQLARDLNRCSEDEVASMIRDPKNVDAFDSLVILFRRQYWWRIWVIQEVSCAQDCTVYCGEETISYAMLENVCDILREHVDLLQNIYYSRLSWIRTLTYGGPKSLLLSRFSPTASRPPLFELLVSHKSKKSTDPKDKVYALLGISSSRDSFGDIDYSLSMREVYSHTARHIIRMSKMLDVICVKQHNLNQFNLPTWVPDWTRTTHSAGQTVVGLQHHQPPFSAAGSSLAEGATFLQDGYVLQTRGMVLDRIKEVGLPFKREGAPGDVNPVLLSFNNWWKMFVESYRDSTKSRVLFAKCISCEKWMFDDDKSYTDKVQAIFDFIDSGQAIKYTGSKSGPEPDDEDPTFVRAGTPTEEKTQVTTILDASISMNKRTLFISDSIVGLAPWDARPKDLVCVLPGCKFPVVLRTEGKHYILIGEVYVEGYMQGKAMDELKEGKFQLETFEIH